MNRVEALALFHAARQPLSQARGTPLVAAVIDQAATAQRAAVIEKLRASLPTLAGDALQSVDVRSVPAGALGRTLRAHIAGLADAEQRKAAAQLDTVEDPLPGEDTRLTDIPLLRAGIDLGRFYAVADGVGLAASLAEDLARSLGSPEAVSDVALADLVQARTLSADEARRLGAARAVFLLSDDDAALTRAVAGRSLRDLLALSSAAWAKLLTTAPPGYDLTAWATELARRFATLAPSQALHGRLLALDDEDIPGAALKAPLAKFAAVYPNVDWLSLDLTQDSPALKALQLEAHFDADTQAALLGGLKAQQRVYAVAADVDTTVRLLHGGYHSAPAIALATPAKLVDLGLDLPEAERVHANATTVLTLTAHMAVGIHDLVQGPFGQLPVANLGADARNYLAQLDGYAALFGNQAWCDCRQCSSILSPAAYFVDLMAFIDAQIREKDGLFTRQYPDHVLDLKVRRPDLWTLPLTCANTDTQVPTLELINEVLETFIATRTGFAGALTDRAALTTHVYRQALYGQPEVRAFDQPFCLPYARITRLLSQAGKSRADVAAVVGGDATRQRLLLSPRARTLAFTADTNRARLSGLFGIMVAGLGPMAPVEVPHFLRTTGLSRDALTALVTAWFVRGADAPQIVAEKSSPTSVQNDVERIHGLTPAVLDRLHRFVRLGAATGLSFADLDHWLHQRNLAVLDAAAGDQIARLMAIRATLATDLDDTLALVGDLPSALVGRFNKTPAGGRLPLPGVAFVHPAFHAAPAADPYTHRLCAGLNVPEEDLARLIRSLRGPLGVGDDAAGFALSAANLALLYRHARLARALKLRIEPLFQLLALVDGPHPWVSDLDDLERVLAFVADWRASQRSLDALGFILGGPVLDPAVWPAVADVVAQLRAEPAEAFWFADTVFATTLGLPETTSRGIVAANAALFEPAAGGLRLAANFSFAAVVVPAGVDPQAVRAVLRAYHLAAVLPARLARALKLDDAKAAGLLGVAGANLDAPDPALVMALRGDGPPSPLTALTARVLRLHALCAAPELDAEALAFVAERPDLFELALPGISAQAVWAIDRYARFTRAPQVAFGETATALPRGHFHDLLRAHQAGAFPADQTPALAQVLGADGGLAATVRAVVPTGGALETLDRLARAVELARALGVSGDTLPRLLADDYDLLDRAADVLEAGFRLRYPDEATAQTQLAPVEGALYELRRDALCGALLRSLAPNQGLPWQSRGDLSHYFLLDVDMGGCGHTSRLVAGISSLQRYVQRVQMNLEQDQREADDPLKLRVQLAPEAAQEWTWRQNYRVWEANRKVFLWPENYLEPDLRDDKTDQFVELESNLLQQEINPLTVQDAYARYLAGFEEVAQLRLGGVWYEASAALDRLHLFGATPSDPPIWYYRHVDNLRFSRWNQAGVRWSNWVKLDVQIPVREVAPVVFEGRLHLFWVEIRTKSVNQVQNGGSTFVGYDHNLTLKFTTLRPDQTWTAPQTMTIRGWPYPSGAGVIKDRKLPGTQSSNVTLQPFDEAPQDDYTLRGASWERVIPDVDDTRLRLTLSNQRVEGTVDLYGRRLDAALTNPGPNLHHLPRRAGRANDLLLVETLTASRGRPNAAAAIMLDEQWEVAVRAEVYPDFDWFSPSIRNAPRIGGVPSRAELHPVPRSAGAPEDAIIQVDHDPLLFYGSAETGAAARIVRLGTTRAPAISRALFEGGVDALLARRFQQETLIEDALPITLASNRVTADTVPPGLDGAKATLRGPYGAWYRELFFHIPWRIAQHLNAQGQYAAAQRWFHFLFDPTAADASGPDRVWRYLGFRELVVPSLRTMLSDRDAIEAYQAEPFNPHAIARLRPTAYQKNLVMRYVDNLLDWADALFTQFTHESINEAVLLYTLASDILGERPARLGACGEFPEPRDYEHIKPLLGQGTAFLAELQTWTIRPGASPAPLGDYGADTSTLTTAQDPARRAERRGTPAQGPQTRAARLGEIKPATGATTLGWSVVQQLSPAFCVPPNRELLAYWDRVEDRLHKIRSCRDINGVPRVPALFAPELDPRLLVRARALGLSLDEVQSSAGGALPPYRFLYLIEKAKAMASTVAGFGAALLSALEKRDAEQLNRLRLVQQQNITQLTTQLRRWELEVAEEGLAAVDRQIEAAAYRQTFYADLQTTGRTGWEKTQSVAVHTASIGRGLAAVLSGSAGLLYLLPQLGSPFAMKYGGSELGGSMKEWAAVARDTAGVADLVAASAGLEASFERRDETWEHQRLLAEHDLKQLQHQRKIAALRVDLAARSLELHEENIAQIEELFAFYDGKFTGIGLYTWLATLTQRMHRGAYQNALALARLADEAFRYERGTSDFNIDGAYWDARHAGLGAGEQLLLALQSLERRFIETNHRTHEIDQAFSLQQVAPAALLQLRETGTCTFELPELFFDLAYPGHYRRRIRAVRLTIPCVTGPYVNIGAVLSLQSAEIRSEPTGPRVPLPVQRSVSIATSTAQNDGGVFELSFRDERYMPFEGAGAVHSRWRLELPSNFRAFDYDSIHDVILSLAYTAEYDAALRDRVQADADALEQNLMQALQAQAMPRLIRLRHDFAAAFNRLLHQPPGTPVDIVLGPAQRPFFLNGRTFEVTQARLGLELADGADPADFALVVDNQPLVWGHQPQLAGMWGAELPSFIGDLGAHTFTVAAAGGLAPAPNPLDPSALDDTQIQDVILYLELKLT